MGIFSGIAMAVTGKVLNQIDTPIMDGACEVSLRLKQKNNESNAYVVLAGIAAENYQYYPMKAEEFVQFADAVQVIKNQLLSMSKK
jgi:hypothetical protein